MVRKVEYNDTELDNKSIAHDSYFHMLLKTAKTPIMNMAVDFYSKTLLTRDMRYSGIHNKIISIK